jgi:hypothetical protein
MITLSHAVGRTGRNKPVDVMIIQHLLNLNHDPANLGEPLAVTGTVDTDTADAIESFQSNAMGSKKPDGRVDPGGKTLSKLASKVKNSDTFTVLRSVLSASSETAPARPAEASSALSDIDDFSFLNLYDRQFVRLGASARAGLTELIGFINDDMGITDVLCSSRIKPHAPSRSITRRPFGITRSSGAFCSDARSGLPSSTRQD